MGWIKRIFLFLAINFLVVFTISLVLNLFHVQPYLTPVGLNIKSLLIICLAYGMGGAFISLCLSKVMAKWLMRVKIIDSQTNDPQLRSLMDMVEKLSKQANLPVTPEVGVFPAKEINAFATGPTKKRALIAVSSALLEKMDENEREGVLAHEISHIVNGDMVTMTLIQGVVNAFVMFLARILAYAFSGLGQKREGSNGGSYMSFILFTYLFEFVFLLLGSILIFWFSRFREFRADRGGAMIAGKQKMISALERLQTVQRIRDEKMEKPALAALMISRPGRSGLLSLFASHPPLDVRIERLKFL